MVRPAALPEGEFSLGGGSERRRGVVVKVRMETGVRRVRAERKVRVRDIAGMFGVEMGDLARSRLG